MLRIILLIAAMLAVAAAAPQLLLGAPWPYAAHGYAARSYALPSSYAFNSGYHTYHAVEPVEQHGYQIAY